MAIKSRDGSVYKLRGPNPLMESQADWDKSKMKLINMGRHNSEVHQDKKPNVVVLPVIPKATPIPARNFLAEAAESEPAKPEPKPEPPPVTRQEELPEDIKRLFDAKGEKYFCAPAIGTKTHLDSLYGDTYQTIQYGDKYLFDALILDQTDLSLSLWCVRQITVNSIVYRKVQGGGERWWRVRSVEPKTGGYVVVSMPSDSNPDFS